MEVEKASASVKDRSGSKSAREREREVHYVHSASLAYEDGVVFTSEPSAARQRDNGRQTSGPSAT